MDGLTSAGVVVSIDDGGAVGRITLSRPEKLNALSIAVLEDLAAAAVWFDERPEVKVVVVAGEGPSFSAGFDLADPSWRAEGADPAANTRAGRAMADAIGSMGALTIASIRGHCIGGGVVLAAACDLRVVSDTARFKIPEVDLGVPLYWTGIPRLVRELGPALTKELVLTGRTFDAEEARSIRFANRLVPDAELEAATDALAAELAAKPGDRDPDHQAPGRGGRPVRAGGSGGGRARQRRLAGGVRRPRGPRRRCRLRRLAAPPARPRLVGWSGETGRADRGVGRRQEALEHVEVDLAEVLQVQAALAGGVRPELVGAAPCTGRSRR